MFSNFQRIIDAQQYNENTSDIIVISTSADGLVLLVLEHLQEQSPYIYIYTYIYMCVCDLSRQNGTKLPLCPFVNG